MVIPKLVFVNGSFFLAILLTILPLPHWVEVFRPAWVALALIYWVMVLPQSVSLGGAWCLGVLLDVLDDALLGEHALALLVVAYLVSKFYQQLRMFPVWQQGVAVACLVMCYQLTIGIVQGMIDESIPLSVWLWPPLISGLLWPWVCVLLQQRTKHFEISLLH